MKNPLDICRELVRLSDAGIRPQVCRGMLREEQDFYELVEFARKIVSESFDENKEFSVELVDTDFGDFIEEIPQEMGWVDSQGHP